MTLLENNLYKEDVKHVATMDLPWEKLAGKTVLLSGATGLVGSFLIDVINYRNSECGSNTKIVALGRNKQRIYDRFGLSGDTELFKAIVQDVNDDLSDELLNTDADFVLHLASNTHPLQYSTDPIGTIITNIIGLRNMLDFAADKKAERFVFASSVEVYGENRGDTERFAEDYLGYIDCNTMRAGYPESKRAGEALCQAYMKQKELDVVIPRLSRTYGPSMLKTDTKAISQFIKKGVDKENIILKSEGNQLYSYSYVADAVSGVLYCLFLGKSGEAYNIADPASDITLKDMAAVIADYAGTEVIFELPDATEAAGYSKATKAILDSAKLKSLGWKADFDMNKGLIRTIEVLREIG